MDVVDRKIFSYRHGMMKATLRPATVRPGVENLSSDIVVVSSLNPSRGKRQNALRLARRVLSPHKSSHYIRQKRSWKGRVPMERTV
jgi:hypothetical protein